MSGNILAISTGVASFDSPDRGISFPDWFFSLADRQFQALTPGYVGGGTSRAADGSRLCIAVELLNDNVAVHRYVERQSDPDRCYLRSRSDYFHSLGQTTLDIAWDMTVAQISFRRAQIMSTVVVRSTPEFEALMARSGHSLDKEIRQLQRYVDDRCSRETSSLANQVQAHASGLTPEVALGATQRGNGQLIADASCSTFIDVPYGQIDLSDWLFRLSDGAFRACSAAHLAAGASHVPSSGFELLTVEQPGTLVVHHYRALIATPGHCRLVSPNSDVFVGGTRSTVSTFWNLSLAAYDQSKSLLTNHLVIKSTPALETCLARQGFKAGDVRSGQTAVVADHAYEETPRIAREIECLVKAASSGAASTVDDEHQQLAV